MTKAPSLPPPLVLPSEIRKSSLVSSSARPLSTISLPVLDKKPTSSILKKPINESATTTNASSSSSSTTSASAAALTTNLAPLSHVRRSSTPGVDSVKSIPAASYNPYTGTRNVTEKSYTFTSGTPLTKQRPGSVSFGTRSFSNGEINDFKFEKGSNTGSASGTGAYSGRSQSMTIASYTSKSLSSQNNAQDAKSSKPSATFTSASTTKNPAPVQEKKLSFGDRLKKAFSFGSRKDNKDNNGSSNSKKNASSTNTSSTKAAPTGSSDRSFSFVKMKKSATMTGAIVPPNLTTKESKFQKAFKGKKNKNNASRSNTMTSDLNPRERNGSLHSNTFSFSGARRGGGGFFGSFSSRRASTMSMLSTTTTATTATTSIEPLTFEGFTSSNVELRQDGGVVRRGRSKSVIDTDTASVHSATSNNSFGTWSKMSKSIFSKSSSSNSNHQQQKQQQQKPPQYHHKQNQPQEYVDQSQQYLNKSQQQKQKLQELEEQKQNEQNKQKNQASVSSAQPAESISTGLANSVHSLSTKSLTSDTSTFKYQSSDSKPNNSLDFSSSVAAGSPSVTASGSFNSISASTSTSTSATPVVMVAVGSSSNANSPTPSNNISRDVSFVNQPGSNASSNASGSVSNSLSDADVSDKLNVVNAINDINAVNGVDVNANANASKTVFVPTTTCVSNAVTEANKTAPLSSAPGVLDAAIQQYPPQPQQPQQQLQQQQLPSPLPSTNFEKESIVTPTTGYEETESIPATITTTAWQSPLEYCGSENVQAEETFGQRDSIIADKELSSLVKSFNEFTMKNDQLLEPEVIADNSVSSQFKQDSFTKAEEAVADNLTAHSPILSAQNLAKNSDSEESGEEDLNAADTVFPKNLDTLTVETIRSSLERTKSLERRRSRRSTKSNNSNKGNNVSSRSATDVDGKKASEIYILPDQVSINEPSHDAVASKGILKPSDHLATSPIHSTFATASKRNSRSASVIPPAPKIDIPSAALLGSLTYLSGSSSNTNGVKIPTSPSMNSMFNFDDGDFNLDLSFVPKIETGSPKRNTIRLVKDDDDDNNLFYDKENENPVIEISSPPTKNTNTITNINNITDSFSKVESPRQFSHSRNSSLASNSTSQYVSASAPLQISASPVLLPLETKDFNAQNVRQDNNGNTNTASSSSAIVDKDATVLKQSHLPIEQQQKPQVSDSSNTAVATAYTNIKSKTNSIIPVPRTPTPTTNTTAASTTNNSQSSLRQPTASFYKPHNVSFSSRIIIYDTYNCFDYDRRAEPSTCNRLTPLLAQQIKEELNHFKMEMDVHAESRIYTHFYG